MHVAQNWEDVMDLERLPAAAKAIIAPGGRFELVDAEIRGLRMRVFKDAPPNLTELYRGALEFADETFFVYEDERYTFADAWREARRVAAALQSLGVGKGDRVGIAMRNYPEWVWAFMGSTAMGAVAVCMNAWWSGEEMMYGIEDSGLKTLFVDRERLEHVALYLDERDLHVIAVRTEHTSGRGVQNWQQFIDGAGTDGTEVVIEPDDDAILLYTSGSTARPKGVLSSHRAVIHGVLGWEANSAIGQAIAGKTAEPRTAQPATILTVPLFHVTGLSGQLLTSFRPGRKVIGMHKWDAEKALAIIERERVTHFSGVPTMAQELINSPNFSKYDLSCLRNIGGGGAAMAPQHSQHIHERTNRRARPQAAYGMTETNGLGTSNRGAKLLSKPNSCGQAVLPLVEIKIAGTDGEVRPRGATGEIWIRGPMNFTAYWKQPEATAETLVDGWVRTGDIGHMDDEEFVYITDRAKDMIIRGGENVGCQEVEAVIYEHAHVTECAVFGIPDERLGETVAAVVMAKPGEILTAADIRSYVADRVARFKVPEHVWVWHDQLPRTASGKIYKRGLRDDAIAALGNADVT
jgi:long-chain acyl-CoA synthetase